MIIFSSLTSGSTDTIGGKSSYTISFQISLILFKIPLVGKVVTAFYTALVPIEWYPFYLIQRLKGCFENIAVCMCPVFSKNVVNLQQILFVRSQQKKNWTRAKDGH